MNNEYKLLRIYAIIVNTCTDSAVVRDMHCKPLNSGFVYDSYMCFGGCFPKESHLGHISHVLPLLRLHKLLTSLRPLFFEYLFYKPADHSWNLQPGNKIVFYSFYYYFPTDPPEYVQIRLPLSLIQNGDRSVPLWNYHFDIFNGNFK